MRLIIDIDEEQYEFIKEYVKEHDLFEEVYQNIADGIPVNTNNKPCDNCQEFDCWGCGYKENK